MCVAVAETPYRYIAVVSRSEGSDSLNHSNPGPDLDAISISAGGTELFASVIESSQQGPEGDQGNTRPLSTHATAVTVKDTVNAAGTCDLELGDGDGTFAGYVAIGGIGGYIVVSFPREIATGDTVKVYEIDRAYCSTASRERPDAYEVYVTTDASLATNPGSADNIRTNWCLVGAQSGNGGVFSSGFNAAICP